MYRNLNETNEGRSYNVVKLYEGSETCLVDYGNDEPKHLIHEDEKGYYINDNNEKRYFSNKMNDMLRAQGVKGINEALTLESVNNMKYKIKTQLLELIAMLQGGYTTDINQLKRLLGIETANEEYFFTRWLEELEMIGSIEMLSNNKVFII